MKLTYSVIKHNINGKDITFAIVIVNSLITNYTTRIIQYRNELSQFFPHMSIILMSYNRNQQHRFYGRKDIVDFLQTIKLEQIPWKTLTIV